MNPFDYVKSINKKEHIDLSDIDSNYSQFLINRNFSYFIDTAIQANEMNIRNTQYHNLQNIQHYDYLNTNISKANRFSKWEKPITNEEVELIKQVYKYTTKKAIDVVHLFSEDDIKKLRLKVDIGGRY